MNIYIEHDNIHHNYMNCAFKCTNSHIANIYSMLSIGNYNLFLTHQTHKFESHSP